MLKIGIISDIHCHIRTNPTRGGYYFPNMPDEPSAINPFSSLKKLLREKNIKFDFLLTPGDFAHQIDKEGLNAAWNQLKLISIESNSKKLIGTIGNHDVSSRSSGDSFEDIKTFDYDFPIYPSDDSTIIKGRLLSDNFFIHDEPLENISILTINTSFNHHSELDAKFGEINQLTLDKIEKEYTDKPYKFKIALMHHHPIIHETGIFDTNDIIKGGEKLVELLEKLDFDLVVHGHKHDFRFKQIRNHPKNLNILGSGSFSCYKTSLIDGSLNSFHIVELDLKNKIPNCENQGKIKTFRFSTENGWNEFTNEEIGFGCTLSDSEIYDILLNYFKAFTKNIIFYSDLILDLPFLNHISKKNILTTFKKLEVNKEIFNINYDILGNFNAIIISDQ